MSASKETVLELIFGRWRSQILYAGVELGVFDALGDVPKSSDDLASELGVDAQALYRLMRALASLQLLIEHWGRQFSLSSAGQFLRSDHPESLRGVTLLEEGPEHYAIWKHLPDMIRDGRQNAFVREFGHMAFEHTEKSPRYAKVFNEAMNSFSSLQTAWALEALEDYDFSPTVHICDVGGGHGHMLCSFLSKYPHLKGTVFELPSVIADEEMLWARKLNVQDRCEYVAGDMFQEVPPADTYMMKMILHDWNDDECVQILSNIHKSAASGSGVFIFEHLIPGPDVPHFSKLFDIHMMCWGTGRERTAEEYGRLLTRAGWEYADTWPSKTGLIGAVEGRKP